MSTSHLLELPDDTLAEILELCDIAMLRRLASTCRRLQLLAAPMILSEQKSHLETLVASEMLWLGDEPPDIQLILNDNITHAPLLCLLIKYDADLCEVLQSLRLLLSHLTSIDRAELVFAVGDPKVAVHRGWMYLLGDVLNLLAEKTTTLGVEGGAGWPTEGLPEVASRLPPPEPETPRRRESYIRRIASRCARPLTNVLQHLTIGSTHDSTSVDTPPKAIEEPTTSCDIVLELPPRLSITDLQINSSLFFHLPFSTWTQHILHHAPLIKLTFKDIGLPVEEWDYVLASPVHIRTLSQLSVRGRFRRSDNIMEFVTRNGLKIYMVTCMGTTVIEARRHVCRSVLVTF